jgi:hypothetical protein
MKSENGKDPPATSMAWRSELVAEGTSETCNVTEVNDKSGEGSENQRCKTGDN